VPEHLTIRESHAVRDLKDGRIDASHSGKGVANDGQQCVQRQRGDGETVGARTKPGDWQQQSEKREAGNGLDHVVGSEHDGPQFREAHQDDAQRNADEQRDRHRPQHKAEMFDGQHRNLDPVFEKEVEK
jgi:hypothetical protein